MSKQNTFTEITFRDDLSKYLINRDGEIYSINKHKVLKPQTDIYGYLGYVLYNDNGEPVKVASHIAVAKQFVKNDNPAVKIYVNHIDENKQNPCVDNLEWVTPKENTNHGTAIERSSNHRKKPVNEYTIDGRYVRTWGSIKDIAEFFTYKSGIEGADNLMSIYNAINQNIKGKQATAYNRVWKPYTNDTSDISVKQGKINNTGIEHSKNKLSLEYDGYIPDEYLYEEPDIADIIAYFKVNEKLTDYEKCLLDKVFSKIPESKKGMVGKNAK